MKRYLILAFREAEPDRYCVLEGEDCVIGRAPDSHLVLPDSTVSRNHAMISVQGDRIFIEDQGSTNGVFVNGERITRTVLREGDFASLGAYTVVLREYNGGEGASSPKGKTLCIGYDTARKLHQESLEKRSPKHFSVLYATALLLGERPPLDEFLPRVLSMVAESLRASRGAIVTYTEDSERLEVAASLSMDHEPDELPVSRTLIEHVLRTRIALLTENAQADPRFCSKESVIRRDIGAAMCVPLVGNKGCAGVFYVDGPAGAPEFTEKGLAFFAAISHVVGLAIENRRQDALLAKQERLATLGQAIAGISHDVRSLLMLIRGSMELMQSAEPAATAPKPPQDWTLMRRVVDRVESYMSSLLTFSNRVEINRVPTPLNDLIQDVLTLLKARAAEAHVELVFKGGGFETANIDGAQIHRVLFNIVRNAIEACGTRGGSVTLSVSRRNDTLIVEISDTGVGIPAEHLARLAEPFFSTKGSAGMGLGLAVSYRIVEQHGGWIHATSKPGRGTTFTIVIPRCFALETAPRDPVLEATKRIAAFKQCPGCGTSWASQDRFLGDPGLVYGGYQVHWDDLNAGLFLFSHTCGTTLAVPVADFRHLYGGPVFQERLTGTDACAGYCLHQNETRPCPAQCACAYVREVMQIIHQWPKLNTVA